MKNFSIAKSRRLRSTPYTDRIEAHGVSGYTVYNHMLLPVSFKSVEADYEHLKKFVQVWDVAAERQVQITGKDSAKLVQLMTCRDLSNSKVGKCYYAPLIDDQGNLVNDPIINKLADDKWWLSIADSDVILFAKGLAIGKKYDEVKLFHSDTTTLEEEIIKLADLPLLYQPRDRWVYSVSMDVLGRILEITLNDTLQNILQKNIFDPLEMNETKFTIPLDSEYRVMKTYEYDQFNSKLQEQQTEPQKIGNYKYPLYENNYARGGHGLFSTIHDFSIFTISGNTFSILGDF